MVVPGFKLDVWNTDFRVIISEKMRKLIRSKVNVVGVNNVIASMNITRTQYYRLMHGEGSSIKTYENLLNYFKLDKKMAEDEIMGLTYFGCDRVYPFIKILTPTIFRIICHVIGDGSIPSSGNTCRWIQNRKNSKYLKNLIQQEIGIYPKTVINKGSPNCEQITINAFFGHLVKYILNVDIRKIKQASELRKLLKLSREYRLQLLFALIVDEGHVRHKGAKSLVISRADKSFMLFLQDLLNSFNYPHSDIKKENYKGFDVYRINVYAQGVYKIYKEVNRAVAEYGNLAGLWHKEDDLREYIHTLNLNFNNTKVEIGIANKIISKLFESKRIVSYEDLRTHLIFGEKLKQKSERYLINKFYELAKCGEVSRISKGAYIKNG